MNPSQLDGCVGINVDDSATPLNSQAFYEDCAAIPFVPVSALSVCRLSPNRVIIVGGRCRNGLVQRFNVIRLLDFERDYGRFDFRIPSRINIRTSVPLAREAHTLTPDAAAKFYVLIGGFRKVDADALSLPPAEAEGGLRHGKRARLSGTAAKAAAPTGTLSDSMWALRPLGDSDFKWESIGSLGKKRTQSCLGPRFGHVAVCREEKSRRASSCVSSIFVHGGYDSVEAQYPRHEVHKLTVSKVKGGLSSAWEAVGMLRKRKGSKHVVPPARAFHAAALLDNRFLAVHGGVNGPCTGLTPGSSPSTFCDDLYVLDIEKRVWCVPSDAESDNSSHRPSPRAFHSAVHGFGPDTGSVIFFGGQVEGKGYQPSAEVFRMTLHLPESEESGSPSVTWAKRDIGPDYALARAGLVSFPDAGKYVVVGGIEESGDTMSGLFGFEPFHVVEETVRDGTMQAAAMDAAGDAPPPSFPHPQFPSATLTPQRPPESEPIVAGVSIKEENLVAPATRSYLQEEQGSSTLEKSLQNEPDEGAHTPRVTPEALEGVARSGVAWRSDIERKVNSQTRDTCDDSGENRLMPSGHLGTASGEVEGSNGVNGLKSFGDGLEGEPAISVQAARDVSSPGDIHVAKVDTARPNFTASNSGGAVPVNEIEPVGKRFDEEVYVSLEVDVGIRSVCSRRTPGGISSEQSAAAAKEGPKGVDSTTPADPPKRDVPTHTGSGNVDCRHDSRNVKSIVGDGHVDDDGDACDVMNRVDTRELPKASSGKRCTDSEDGLPPAKRARLVESVLGGIGQSPHVDDDHNCDRGEPRGVVFPDSIGQDLATDAGGRGSEPLPAETPPSGVPFVGSGPRTSIEGSPYVTAEEYCAMAGVLQPVRGRGRGRGRPRGRPRGRGRGRGAVGGGGRYSRGRNLENFLSHSESDDDADPGHIKRKLEDNIKLRSKMTQMQRDLEATDKALREKASIVDSKNRELRELTAERNVLIHQKNNLVMQKHGRAEAIRREQLEKDMKAEMEKEWKARFDDEVAMRRKAEQQVHEHEQFIINNGLADEQADRDIAECPECERNSTKLEKSKEECRQARMLTAESKKELSNAAEHVSRAESRCEQLDAEKRQIQAKLEGKVQQLSELDNARVEITRFRKTISHQKRELEVMEGKCTEWKSRVTAAATEVAEMRSGSTGVEAATLPSAQCNRKECLRTRTTLHVEQEILGERAKQLAISRGELVTMAETVTRLERDVDRVSRGLAEAERRAEIACEKRDALSSDKDSVSDHLLRVKTEYVLLSERCRALLLGLRLDSLTPLVDNVQKSLGSSGQMPKANGGDPGRHCVCDSTVLGQGMKM